MEKSLKNLLKTLSNLTGLDIKIPYTETPILYNYTLLIESRDSRDLITKKTLKFISYNRDESVLINPIDETLLNETNGNYETIRPKESSSNYQNLNEYTQISRVTNSLVESINEEIFSKNNVDDFLSSTTASSYEYLYNLGSKSLNDQILKEETILIEGGSIENLVTAPNKKKMKMNTNNFDRVYTKSIPLNQPLKDLNNNLTMTMDKNLADIKLNKWLKCLNDSCKQMECRSLPINLYGLDYSCDDSDNEEDDINYDIYALNRIPRTKMSLTVKKQDINENVLLLRNAVFSYINESLKELMRSPLKLATFRRNLISAIEKIDSSQLNDFVNHMFEFFSKSLFHKILKHVRVEWSSRLRSTAASTILDKSFDQSIGVVIRLASNLLNRISRVDLIQILLHEMIHAFLGLAIGDFDPGHNLSFRKILNKLNFILKLDIPIEHDYAETLDLAHIWQCSKCKEKRIRFYNIPPTENQRGEHASKCTGTLIKIKSPK